MGETFPQPFVSLVIFFEGDSERWLNQNRDNTVRVIKHSDFQNPVIKHSDFRDLSKLFTKISLVRGLVNKPTSLSFNPGPSECSTKKTLGQFKHQVCFGPLTVLPLMRPSSKLFLSLIGVSSSYSNTHDRSTGCLVIGVGVV